MKGGGEIRGERNSEKKSTHEIERQREKFTELPERIPPSNIYVMKSETMDI